MTDGRTLTHATGAGTPRNLPTAEEGHPTMPDWLEKYGRIPSEPMTVSDLADWFRVNRRKMTAILSRMEGVQTIGSGKGTRYMVPLCRLPVTYWRAKGLVALRDVENGRECATRLSR